jgi:hypothetical protein
MPATLSSVKLWSFRLIAVSFGFFSVLLVAEVALRIAGWSAPGFYVSGQGPLELRIPGVDGGAFPPNVSGRLKSYEYDVEWTVNADGMRERGGRVKSKDEWRIGLLGDSFAAGVGVEEKQRFGNLWIETTRPQTANITLWNLATPLCGTACAAAILKHSGQHYDLDEIILAFYGGNDIEDNLEWDQNVPVNDPKRRESLHSAKRWLRENSRVATFAWVNGLRAMATFRPPGIYSEIDLQREWPPTERALLQLKESVAVRRLTILYLPATAEWDDSVWQEMKTRYGASEEGRFVVKQAVMRWSAQNSIGFVDTTEWLRQCASQAECVFPVDGHWKPHAHALVAQGFSRFWTTKIRATDIR